ncbi:MAG TPA: S8 family serine peptidase [Candidatus Krumholzibacteria bacterium]|nr:S8 family serine peptidase [Candidatus Krumholzibacteria bacterium]
MLSLTIAAMVAVPASMAQRTTDIPTLQSYAREFRAWVLARRTPLYFDLLRSSDTTTHGQDKDPAVYLMFIRESGMPAYYIPTNLNAAKTVRTWDVWPPNAGGGYVGLTGLSTAPGELGQWDAGGVLTTHQEFQDRVTQMDVPGGYTDHATHVAGTMVASGVEPAARGMSYGAPLHCYDFSFDASEMAVAAANGMQISNHSYGSAAGWHGTRWYGDLNISRAEDYAFGFYNSDAQQYDQIAYAAPYYLMVFAAGNDRTDVAPPGANHLHFTGSDWVSASDVHGVDAQFGGYDTLPFGANAKNILTVGAVEDIADGYAVASDVVQTDFSSWGPTDDGRIKPDIVANGSALYSTSKFTIDSYTTLSGTSMATPNASASINLIAREYERLRGLIPLSSILKAIVINTADEAGVYPGPDCVNGWGLLNVRRAVELLHVGDDEEGGVADATLDNGTTHHYGFSSDGVGDARITVVWTDPAGTPPPPSLDPPTKMLVNDLDIRLLDAYGSTLGRPWTLDREDPSAAASLRDNSTDNVEQIDVFAPAARYYRLTVSHKGSLASGSQEYALVWRGLRPDSLVSTGEVPKYALADPYPNPLRGVSTIEFELLRGEPVSIEVFDVAGRRVASLLNETRPAGPNSVTFNTRGLASGIYFVRMQTPSWSSARKITIVR